MATDAATQVGILDLERVLPPLSPVPGGVVDAEALLGEVASGVTIELVASSAPAPEGLICLDWIAEGARASSCGSGPNPGLLTAVMFSHPERRAIVVIAATSTSRLDVDSPCELREIDISETATIAACDVGGFIGELPIAATVEGQRWSSTIEVPDLPHP